MYENNWSLISYFYLRHFLSYQSTLILYPCVDVQFFREWAGHGASGERVPDAAATQHYQTQGGAVPRVRRLAGIALWIQIIQSTTSSFVNWDFRGVAGGHAVGHQPTGAAEGGGEEEGKPAGEGEGWGTSEEQVCESEGRGRERIFLLFQRHVTKTSSSSSLKRQYQPWACAGLWSAKDVYSLRFDIFMYICEFTSTSHKVFSTLHLYNNVLLFPVRSLPSGMKNSPTGTDRNNIFIKLKFQKTVILFSRPLWLHQIM